MPYSNYFDNPYLSDAYNPGPDYTLNTFFDSDSFFDQPVTSVETTSGISSKSQEMLNSTSTSIPQPFPQIFNPAQFGQPFGQYPYDNSINSTPPQAGEAECVSPATTTSRTSSHCGDGPQQAASPSLSPHMLKRESPSSAASAASASESSTPKRPTRKRGRPKMDRRSTESQLVATSPTLKCQRTKRQPHNQVERKYREGLNSELERLRKAVPGLRQSDEAGKIGQPKPSKAMILASAIEYIEAVERERDALREENERLCRNQGTMGGGGARHELLDEFLMES
ncbi:hypothetical protein TW65_03126 [Stemphylium lycopersici]|uniref:Transcription factor bhlh protein n=1 Tax=Stemphylium lycopersici TaxID=183478 RepID=A0A364NAU1_STELY|nr:hypothetical protein TW65_03126 [Stemphylium lycopersici]RAR14382.1 transcription factor bhlh protein [Stemphylium lycopersici]